jgi:hypothetical protein
MLPFPAFCDLSVWCCPSAQAPPSMFELGRMMRNERERERGRNKKGK